MPRFAISALIGLVLGCAEGEDVSESYRLCEERCEGTFDGCVCGEREQCDPDNSFDSHALACDAKREECLEEC